MQHARSPRGPPSGSKHQREPCRVGKVPSRYLQHYQQPSLNKEQLGVYSDVVFSGWSPTEDSSYSAAPEFLDFMSEFIFASSISSAQQEILLFHFRQNKILSYLFRPSRKVMM